jgi:hypothetical protein
VISGDLGIYAPDEKKDRQPSSQISGNRHASVEQKCVKVEARRTDGSDVMVLVTKVSAPNPCIHIWCIRFRKNEKNETLPRIR